MVSMPVSAPVSLQVKDHHSSSLPPDCKMPTLSSFLQIFLFYFHLALASSSSWTDPEFNYSKPGCESKCGDLNVPWPFGIGGVNYSCSLNQHLNIRCNYSTNPPKASIDGIDGQIVQINETKIRVIHSTLVAKSCYDLSGNTGELKQTDYDAIVIVSGLNAYTLSSDNWIIAVGCDDLATISGRNSGAGCLAFCPNDINRSTEGHCLDLEFDNGTTPEVGCCQSPLPRANSNMSVSLSDVHKNWDRKKSFNCSFAFIREKGIPFSYRFGDLRDPQTFLNNNPAVTATPIVLEWRIGKESCNESKGSACQANECDDVDPILFGGSGGYRCRCKDGYEGNPYLAPGCKDIDECSSTEENSCTFPKMCHNFEGYYNCSCPNGYFGDGKKDGFGCERMPNSKILNVAIGLGSGLGFLVLLAMCFLMHKKIHARKDKRRKEKFFKRNGGLLLKQQADGDDGRVKTNLFVAEELEKATDNFHKSRVLGQGGQGTVYRGILSNGKIVAIKKAKLVDEHQVEQFINEVAILSEINHRNVVKLLGCCLETEVPLLVYEFVPNGTLYDLIHDGGNEDPVSWNARLRMASDIAGAIAYLHSSSTIPIYHRDIKSHNILVDARNVVKVSDFGTCKTIPGDQTHVTTNVMGTFGYMDPEYFQTHQLTEKSDVYSFGVVLLELLTGQTPTSSGKTQEEKSLVKRFLRSMEGNHLDEILDPQVSKQGQREEVIAFARLAARCLCLTGKMRPTMREVAVELENIRISQTTKGDEFQEDNSIMCMELEYPWTDRDSVFDSSTSRSIDRHPLMIEKPQQ